MQLQKVVECRGDIKFILKCISMKKYQIEHAIGNGNFSSVFKGTIQPENLPCAIKIMTTHDTIALRQAQLLNKLKHPNVVSIIDFQQNAKQSRIILEYVGINTLELYEAQPYGLRQQQVKCILFQAALGLSCVHSFGIIHRDIKPENILIDKKCAVVKLIDFGLSIEDHKCVTDYIATRWYRSPQNLLATRQYSCSIDIFSLGCVIVELYLGSPLFPGSNNIDQIHKIFNILGYPSQQNWPKGYEKMREMGIKQSTKEKSSEIDLKSIMNPQDSRLVELVQRMLQLNPNKRISAIQILQHEYFKDIKAIVPPFVYQRFQQDILKTSIKPYVPKNIGLTKPNKVGLSFQSANSKQYSKVNLQNASGKIKYADLKQQKSTQAPQFIRQKKSSSLDYLNKAETLAKKMVSKQKGMPIYLKRKTSTPALILPKNINFSPAETSRIPSIFKDQKLKSPREEQKRKLSQVRISSQIIPQQHTMQLKSSKLTPDGSETTLSHISKVLTPNALQSENNKTSFYQTQCIRNKFYPIVPHAQFVSEDNSHDMAITKHARQIASPITMSHQTQSKNQSKNQSKTQILNISIRTPNQIQTPPPNSSAFTSPLHSPVKTQHILKQLYKKMPLHPHTGRYLPLKIPQKLEALHRPQQYQTKQIQTPQIYVRDQISPRQKYASPTQTQRSHHIEQTHLNYRIDNIQSGANKQVTSPSHRYFGSSPENKHLIPGRQLRLVTVNSPPPQFKNPYHRK